MCNAKETSYHAILCLLDMLALARIPHIFCRMNDGWRVEYRDDDICIIAIEHDTSLGHEEDLIETCILDFEFHETHIYGPRTAYEVFQDIMEATRHGQA